MTQNEYSIDYKDTNLKPNNTYIIEDKTDYKKGYYNGLIAGINIGYKGAKTQIKKEMVIVSSDIILIKSLDKINLDLNNMNDKINSKIDILNDNLHDIDKRISKIEDATSTKTRKKEINTPTIINGIVTLIGIIFCFIIGKYI